LTKHYSDNQINNKELGRSCIKSGKEVAFIHFSRS